MPPTEIRRRPFAAAPQKTLDFRMWDGFRSLEAKAAKRYGRIYVAPLMVSPSRRKVRPLVRKPFRNAAAEARASNQPRQRRLEVDTEAIGAAVDWFTEQDFPPDAGERIRRDAWR